MLYGPQNEHGVSAAGVASGPSCCGDPRALPTTWSCNRWLTQQLL